MRILLIAAALLAIASPTLAQDASALGVSLRYIAQAVHGTVRYDRSADGLEDADLIKYATRDQASLLAPFAAKKSLLPFLSGSKPTYSLQARRDGQLTSVLLCQGETALYEDAGCTGPVDRNVVGKGEPCSFALDLAQTCAKPAKR